MANLPFQPISAADLLDAELAKRGTLEDPTITASGSNSRNPAISKLRFGCAGLDDHVLLGGIEPASVLGLSSEDDTVALQLALQLVAKQLMAGLGNGQAEVPQTHTQASAQAQTALVASTLPVATVARVLRDIVRALQGREGGWREVLGRVQISRVFDVQGLWEVVDELDVDGGRQGGGEGERGDEPQGECETGRVGDVGVAQGEEGEGKQKAPEASLGQLDLCEFGIESEKGSQNEKEATETKPEDVTPGAQVNLPGLDLDNEAESLAARHPSSDVRPPSMEIPDSDDDDGYDVADIGFQFNSTIALSEAAQDNAGDGTASVASNGSSSSGLPELTPSPELAPKEIKMDDVRPTPQMDYNAMSSLLSSSSSLSSLSSLSDVEGSTVNASGQPVPEIDAVSKDRPTSPLRQTPEREHQRQSLVVGDSQEGSSPVPTVVLPLETQRPVTPTPVLPRTVAHAPAATLAIDPGLFATSPPYSLVTATSAQELMDVHFEGPTLQSPCPAVTPVPAPATGPLAQEQNEAQNSKARSQRPHPLMPAQARTEMESELSARPSPPTIIVVTHISTLLTSLFADTPSPIAHNTLQALSRKLRFLSRSLSSSPLIILTNGTTVPPVPRPTAFEPIPTNPGLHQTMPEPTLRSLFSPDPRLTTSKRNRPAFGLSFTQMLDLHLLCSVLPKESADAERIATGHGGRTAWVVEVLLDEIGVWEGKGGERRTREQRWGAVEARKGLFCDVRV
ncbi:hypothetical protein BROUX41_003746 [Berkeleyomyces rouxiae]|uniref:uncharacterized protein n=1 Tax=Berkeleyomyces rouxiae TaxID=2035830 RepID=UPI003B800535